MKNNNAALLQRAPMAQMGDYELRTQTAPIAQMEDTGDIFMAGPSLSLGSSSEAYCNYHVSDTSVSPNVTADRQRTTMLTTTQATDPSATSTGPDKRMTFGVEMEMIGFYRVCGELEDASDSVLQATWPGYVLVPHMEEERAGGYAVMQMIDDLRALNLQINNFFPDSSPQRVEPSPGATPTRWASNSNKKTYQQWTLKFDQSCDLIPGLDDHMSDLGLPIEESPGQTGHMGLELVTPAMSANSLEDYQHIQEVVEYFRHRWKLHVNTTCGLHVHVGIGCQRFSSSQLRRMALMTWTLDALLNPIHPEHRQDARYCVRNRKHSQLAYGMMAADALDGVATNKVPGNFVSIKKREPPRPYVSAEEGILEIKRCITSNQVGRLMWVMRRNGSAYNFDSYFPHAVHDATEKPTIEFRQAAGSINPAWINHWALICTSICNYAIHDFDWDYYNLSLAIRCSTVEAGEENFITPLSEFLEYLQLGSSAEFIRTTDHDQRISPNGPTIDPRPFAYKSRLTCYSP